MNATPKYVVSTNLTEPLPWQPSTLLRDTDGIRRLKAEDGGDILLFGSGDLVQSLIRERLVDEYRLMVHPIVLGTGKRLFRDGVTLSRLELIDSTAQVDDRVGRLDDGRIVTLDDPNVAGGVHHHSPHAHAAVPPSSNASDVDRSR